MKKQTHITLFILLFSYLFSNSLFILKYSADFTNISPVFIIFLYNLFFLIFIFLFIKKFFNLFNNIYFPILMFFVIFLISILCCVYFSSFHTTVTRNLAINNWIGHFLSKNFPYNDSVKPSGFPFLFFLIIPFYILGLSNYLSIFALLVFSISLFLYFRKNYFNISFSLLLLFLSPMYYYEIIVKSDLFFNTAIFLFSLLIFLRYYKPNKLNSLFWGFLLGIFLSTRGIFILIYLIFVFFVFKNKFKHLILFIVSSFFGFSITIIPFVYWNYSDFICYGPFSIQTSYIPFSILLLFLVISLYLGYVSRNIKNVFIYSSIILFLVILLLFTKEVFEAGFVTVLYNDIFDISYFLFHLPFTIFSLNYYNEDIFYQNTN